MLNKRDIMICKFEFELTDLREPGKKETRSEYWTPTEQGDVTDRGKGEIVRKYEALGYKVCFLGPPEIRTARMVLEIIFAAAGNR